ncbi:MAG: alkaline phosphatase family protein, partial [candidate division WOR-3 bacterium]
MSRRLLFIGLDGATFDLIEPLMREGRMPTLARLVSEGVSGPLETVFPPITASAGTSFATGKNPGKHGIFEFILRREGGLRRTAANATLRDGRTVW